MKIKSLVLLMLLTLTTVLSACQGGKEAEQPKNDSPAVESQQQDSQDDEKDQDKDEDDDDDD
jgi:hypothetical protein